MRAVGAPLCPISQGWYRDISVNVLPHSSNPSSATRHRAEGVERSLRFRRTSRLLRHSDFDRVYKQGRRHFGTHLTAFYRRRDEQPAAAAGPRIGFTVGRVLGGAVDRNRIKRRMREAVRAHLASLTANVDVVFNPKKSARDIEFEVLRNEVARAFSVMQEKCSA